MSGKFDELHERLKQENITDSKLNKFAERLFLVNDDLDFIVMVLKSINGDMKLKINERIKTDKINKKNDSDYKEAIAVLEKEQKEVSENECEEKAECENSDLIICDETFYEGSDGVTEIKADGEEIGKINVQIKGEVKKPGAYILNKGDNLSVLLNEAVLTENADVENIDYLSELSEGDAIEIPTQIIEVHISGAVKEPGFKKIKKGSGIEAIIIQAGNLTEEADEESIDYSVRPYNGMFLNVKKKEKICIDISGAVKKPGCYYIYEGDRLGKVINDCGLKDNADTSKINLSDKVRDGEKIVIPFIGDSYNINESAIDKDDKNDKDNDKKEIIREKEPDKKGSGDSETSIGNNDSNIEESQSEQKISGIVVEEEPAVKIGTIETIIKKESYIAERNNRLLQFFKWIKAIIMSNMSKLPGSFQGMLESVEDPVKLQLLTQGYHDGLSKANFTRLLKIQDKTSAEKLKSLISFYITLDTNDEG